jgi:hypothetical protein
MSAEISLIKLPITFLTQLSMSYDLSPKDIISLSQTCSFLNKLFFKRCSENFYVPLVWHKAVKVWNDLQDPDPEFTQQYQVRIVNVLKKCNGFKTVRNSEGGVLGFPIKSPFTSLTFTKSTSDETLAHITKGGFDVTGISFLECSNINHTGYKKMAKHCPNLTSLMLVELPNIDQRDIESIFKKCSKLDSLTVINCRNFSNSVFPMIFENNRILNRLEIRECDIDNVGLEAIANGCPELKDVNLARLSSITQNGLDKFLLACKKLTHTSVMHCGLLKSFVKSPTYSQTW